MDFIPYSRHHITYKDIQEVTKVLKSKNLTQGPYIKKFEKAFSNYVGSKFSVAVSSGTAALHLSVLSLGIKPGDKIITTPLTFSATANCIRYCNGEVVFVDIDPNTYLIDLNKVESLLSKSPKGTYKGIIPVNFSGRVINMERLRNIANEYNIWIVEDACHSPGGYFIDKNNKIQNSGNGEFSDTSIFSFHPVKHIAAGEGGMVTTNNLILYKKLLNLRSHGIQQDKSLNKNNHGVWYYEMQELGYNYRITDIQSALGLSQLSRAKEGINRRKEIAELYFTSFFNKSYIRCQSGIIDGHAYHLYVVEFDQRDNLIYYLRKNKIIAQVHYIPVHLMPYYNNLGWKKGDFPVVEKYYKHCLSIPNYPSLSLDQQKYVIKTIKKFYENYK